MNITQKNELIALVEKYSDGDGIHPTAITGVRCLKLSQPSLKMPVVYNPSFCIILQGSKQAVLESEIYHYGPSEYIVVSVDLPVVGQVIEATAQEPYLSLQLDIDPHELSELISQRNFSTATTTHTERGLFVGKADDALADSILRLARLLDNPQDIPFLAPLSIREIYYRLLNSEHGHTIAQMAIAGSNMQRIADVIRMLKENYTKPIRVEVMAEMANMSPSSFHHHFKEVTAMSPLQYQKRLRLLEARRLMLAEMKNAAFAAYQVGYESSSQFSREYSRMFGAPPSADIERMRVA